MDTKQLMAPVLSNTFTKNDCYKRLLLLQDFIAHAQFGSVGHSATLSEQLLARYANSSDKDTPKMIAGWGDAFLSAVNDSSGAAIEDLKKYVAALPDLVLYVPVVFEAEQIRSIGEWCRKNIAPELFLDLRVDRSTAGGCIVVWKNVLYDFSLEYFMRKHEQELSRLVQETLSTNSKEHVLA